MFWIKPSKVNRSRLESGLESGEEASKQSANDNSCKLPVYITIQTTMKNVRVYQVACDDR